MPCLNIRNPASGSAGRRNIQESRFVQPNKKRFAVRKIVGSGELWIIPCLLAATPKASSGDQIRHRSGVNLALVAQHGDDKPVEHLKVVLLDLTGKVVPLLDRKPVQPDRDRRGLRPVFPDRDRHGPGEQQAGGPRLQVGNLDVARVRHRVGGIKGLDESVVDIKPQPCRDLSPIDSGDSLTVVSARVRAFAQNLNRAARPPRECGRSQFRRSQFRRPPTFMKTVTGGLAGPAGGGGCSIFSRITRAKSGLPRQTARTGRCSFGPEQSSKAGIKGLLPALKVRRFCLTECRSHPDGTGACKSQNIVR
jgi:hypothetical protein